MKDIHELCIKDLPERVLCLLTAVGSPPTVERDFRDASSFFWPFAGPLPGMGDRAKSSGIKCRCCRRSCPCSCAANPNAMQRYHVKLADFDLATEDQSSNHTVGTPGYMAPEVMLATETGGFYDKSCDVFAFGCGPLPPDEHRCRGLGCLRGDGFLGPEGRVEAGPL